MEDRGFANPKKIVADGYDRIAERHLEWALDARAEERARYTDALLHRLRPGAEVLELGCGVGIPTTLQLAERFDVTGVDISGQQIALARQNVPSARFLHADMAVLDLPPSSFDGVAAFYSLIHLPRDEQGALLQAIALWLRPGGWLVATLGADEVEAGFEEDWLGAPMYWSSFDAETNQRLVADAGLYVASACEETAEEFGQPVTFLWIIAQKPAPGVEGILNFLRISDTLGTAGQPRPEQFDAIRAAGYQAVINLALLDSTGALPNERELVTGLGMEYVPIPVVWESPTLADLEQFLAVVDRLQGQKVLVHCAMNMRVSVFVMLYRVLRQGVPLAQAREQVQLIWQPDEVWTRFLNEALAHFDRG